MADAVTPPSSPSAARAVPAAAVAQFKLPTFSVLDAPTWFRRAEVQFRLKRLTSATIQADHVLASLPDDLFPRISEWLLSKGDGAIEYCDLKNFLLQRFTPSPASRVSQLLHLSKQPLGDQRPSEALLEMKALARLPPAADGSERKLDLLRALWLLRLPESIRAVIPNAEEMDEDSLQQMADRLLDAQAAVGRHINAVPSATATQSRDDDIATLNVAPVRSRQPPRQHLGTRPHPRQQQPRERFIDGLCYFHARFGPDARNCKVGCTWPKNV